MPTLGNCHFCGEPVTTGQSIAWPAEGWEPERNGGGLNHLIDRHRVNDGRVAHKACAERRAAQRRRGINDDQATLI